MKLVKTTAEIELWPVDGLEAQSVCPACGSSDRELLHEGLTDRVFFCAPGTWTLHQCTGCRSAYLDPRPTPETVSRAYSSYYTHAVRGANSRAKPSFKRSLQKALANGYRNHRFHTRLKPSNHLGVWVAHIMPDKRAVLDAEGRHLKPARHGERLLDIGCGNGAFLDLARHLGWEAVGVDFDSGAVEVSRSLGLDVRLGSVDVLDPAVEQFDGITLSHLIEHVHDPEDLLRACYRLLKPGGWIWLETPNVESTGHALYGRNWLHLDPPRHLVLFNSTVLVDLLSKVGFSNAENQPYQPVCASSFSASDYIIKGLNPIPPPTPTVEARALVKQAEPVARRDVKKREFVTLKAHKPS